METVPLAPSYACIHWITLTYVENVGSQSLSLRHENAVSPCSKIIKQLVRFFRPQISPQIERIRPGATTEHTQDDASVAGMRKSWYDAGDMASPKWGNMDGLSCAVYLEKPVSPYLRRGWRIGAQALPSMWGIARLFRERIPKIAKMRIAKMKIAPSVFISPQGGYSAAISLRSALSTIIGVSHS